MARNLEKLLKRARTRARKGKISAALSLFQKASEMAPRSVAVWEELGLFATSNELPEVGIQALFRAADLCAQSGHVVSAVDLCERVLAVSPKHSGARSILKIMRRRLAALDNHDSPPIPKLHRKQGQVVEGTKRAASAPPTESLARILADSLSSSPLLNVLDTDLVRYLLEVSSVTNIQRGEVVFSEGEKGTSLFLVAQGEVEVVRSSDEGEQVLATLGTGALFGEMALLGGPPRTATVRASQSTMVLEIEQPAMRKLIQKDRRVLEVLMRFLRERTVSNMVAMSPFLAHLTQEKRMSITHRFRICERPPEHPIINQNQATDGLYLVLAGALRVYVTDEGKERILGVLGPGDVFW